MSNLASEFSLRPPLGCRKPSCGMWKGKLQGNVRDLLRVDGCQEIAWELRCFRTPWALPYMQVPAIRRIPVPVSHTLDQELVIET